MTIQSSEYSVFHNNTFSGHVIVEATDCFDKKRTTQWCEYRRASHCTLQALTHRWMSIDLSRRWHYFPPTWSISCASFTLLDRVQGHWWILAFLMNVIQWIYPTVWMHWIVDNIWIQCDANQLSIPSSLITITIEVRVRSVCFTRDDNFTLNILSAYIHIRVCARVF